MTRNEARGNLIHAIRWNDIPKKEALEIAIKAMEKIEKIKSIINNDPFYFRGMPAYMQEDVLKYKVICELLKEAEHER